MNVPTVREVWQFALPAATRIVAGENSLGSCVTWVATMHMTPPFFGQLEGGELVFLISEFLNDLGDQVELESIITELAKIEIAGIVVLGAVEPDAVKIADQKQLPLLVLPRQVSLREVEQAVVRLIVDYQAQLALRSEEIYEQLARLYLENRGLGEIARMLSQLIDAPIVIQNQELEILESTSTIAVDWKELIVTSVTEIDDEAKGIIIQPVSNSPYIRYTVPVAIENEVRGYITTASPVQRDDALLSMTLERGAQICALEFAKERAVSLAAEKWRGQFIDLILDSDFDKSAIEHRARVFNYPLAGTQLALLFDVANASAAARTWLNQLAQAFVTETQRLGWQIVLCPYNSTNTDHEQLAALCALRDSAQFSQIRHLLDAAVHQPWLSKQPKGWWCAWGQVATGIEGLRTSFTQAEQALAIGQSLLPDEHFFYFSDLGLYRLLVSLRDNPELHPFLRETLGVLEEYDEKHGAELISTLAIFLEHHGNVSQTAAALNLHRNSLIYRLSRIAELTARDLDSADVRLSLHLALKLREMIR